MTDDYTYDCDCGVHVINDYGQDHECQWRPFAVYGTLRPGCGNDRLWQGNAAPIGLGHVTGFRLVSNGAFPYAVPTEDQRIVVEMVMPHVGRYADILWRMDALEGVPHHYTRERVTVAHRGETTECWMYVPVHDVGRMPTVPGGDWLQRHADAWDPDELVRRVVG